MLTGRNLLLYVPINLRLGRRIRLTKRPSGRHSSVFSSTQSHSALPTG